MRNYYHVLELERSASSKELSSSLNALSTEQIAEEDDLQAIMETTEWRNHYRQCHLQYEAIAAAMNDPRLQDTLDSHQWDKRVIEFEPEQNTIEFNKPGR